MEVGLHCVNPPSVEDGSQEPGHVCRTALVKSHQEVPVEEEQPLVCGQYVAAHEGSGRKPFSIGWYN